MIPLAELMLRFEKLAAQKQLVRLLNTYRGVPVVHDAWVNAVRKGYVIMDVHPEQAACLSLEAKTYIQSPLLPEVVKAQAISVDFAKKQVILTEFAGAGTSPGKRITVRVQPQEPVEVTLHDGEHRVTGQLVDISSSGIGIFTVAAYTYEDLSFSKGSTIYIEFQLPVTGNLIRMKGKINHLTHQQGTFMHRLGLSLLPDPEVEVLLKAYVALRQGEIMDELRRVAASMGPAFSSKNQG